MLRMNASDFSILGIAGANLVALLALMLVIWRIARGFKNGLVAEGSGLFALAGTYYLLKWAGELLAEKISSLPVSGKYAQLMVYLVAFYLVYKLLSGIFKRVGANLRRIPFLGWVDGALGAVLGCLSAAFVLYLVEKMTGLDVKRCVEEFLTRLPVSLPLR